MRKLQRAVKTRVLKVCEAQGKLQQLQVKKDNQVVTELLGMFGAAGNDSIEAVFGD